MSYYTGRAAIVGCGLVGRGWAVLFARAGYKVQLWDQDHTQIARALEDIERSKLPTLAAADMLEGKTVQQVFHFISGASSLSDALKDADWFQECVPEVSPVHTPVATTINARLLQYTTKRTSCTSQRCRLYSPLLCCRIFP